ncbi:OHCU decarboxylase [Achromobacter sp. HZ28]|nr:MULTISPECIES: 2-oxo-4-hydroxy-4-carboxy-5-ureidoimidazoline decarboxylase [unclassified Achromobacter]OWT81083.1 OHCU decarboxylase [Achromobacter sp. HZ34]OWT82584.1 OHCU decarboxylase [Achromobacter sp. HZ28]
MPSALTLDALNHCSEEQFVACLGAVFEHADWVARAAASQRPFADVDTLHAAMMALVRRLPEAECRDFLAAHPELAGVEARMGVMGADSTVEQGSLALAALAPAATARWDELNHAYRHKFDFPFILCVRRHTRASALHSCERRLANDRATELATALDEIGRITRLRLAARIEGHGLANIAGRLTTHVLDTASGRPAHDLRIQLFEMGDGERLLADVRTRRDGRSERPLMDGSPLPIGQYELRFHLGDYFRANGLTSEEPPFLDVVRVAFGIAEPESHYHVPLTATPWSYSTYRGS